MNTHHFLPEEVKFGLQSFQRAGAAAAAAIDHGGSGGPSSGEAGDARPSAGLLPVLFPVAGDGGLLPAQGARQALGDFAPQLELDVPQVGQGAIVHGFKGRRRLFGLRNSSRGGRGRGVGARGWGGGV